MHSQAATTETIPMVKANGEGLDAPNLALDNSKVVPKERGIVTEVQAKSMERVDENVGNQTTSFGPWMLVSKNQPSTHTPKHFEGKEEKLKLPSQEGRSKKTQNGKTPSILKYNLFAIQSKGVSKTRMERKEAGSQSFEAVVNKGKEVDSSPSPAAKNWKEDDYCHSINLIRQAQFMIGGDKLGLEGLPYVQTYLPSKEDIRTANKINRNMGDVGTTSNPPTPEQWLMHTLLWFLSRFLPWWSKLSFNSSRLVLLCSVVFFCSRRSETCALLRVLKPLLCSAVVPCSILSGKSTTLRRSPLSLKPLASASVLSISSSIVVVEVSSSIMSKDKDFTDLSLTFKYLL
ncbi:hypothetical protein S245_056609, partial [Arachis hypogaea]